MDKRKHRNKPPDHEQDNTLDASSVGTSKLQQHDAPYHKDNPDKGGKEPNPMRNPIGFIKGWWSHLGDSRNSNRIVAIFTIVIALTSIGYAVFAYKQWGIMRETFIAANKPSVGVSGFVLVHEGVDQSGKRFNSSTRTDSTVQLQISVEIKNFGPVAAEDFISQWKVFIDGREETNVTPSTPPRTIFPGQVIVHTGVIGSRDYPDIMSGAKTLELRITVRYGGANQRYAYCETNQYFHQIGTFVTTGSCPVT
jgi:hypothetical protein